MVVLAVLAVSSPASAQSGRNVLVVVNLNHSESVEIGDYYARARGVPEDQVLRLDARFAAPPPMAVPALSPRPGAAAGQVPDEITRAEYERQIEAPIARWLLQQRAHDRIHYIVLTKGIPLRIGGSTGRNGTRASVDSELTLLYRRVSGRPVAPEGAIDNPFYVGDGGLTSAARFTHERHDIFLVTRLDGFTVRDVKALIDRGQAPRNEGRVVLDMKAPESEPGNAWLAAAAERLTEMGLADRVTLDRSSEVVRGGQPVIGYFSWGSGDPATKRRATGFTFVPGALAASFVSTDARTFAEPAPTWSVGNWNRRETWFAGSPESLAGDLLREGVTGLAANTAEPFLDRTVRPQVLFAAYLSGFNLAEAFYLAMPSLGWQGVVVGDPLCAIATRDAAEPASLDPELDPDTELPRFFSARRVDVQRREDLAPDVLKLTIRASVRLARGERADAVSDLEKATSMNPGLTGAHVVLAGEYEATGNVEGAAARYRLALEQDPKNVVALNNLAFLLATRLNKPAEALPLAEQAYTASRGAATVADTLGWVHHLMGNHAEAAVRIDEALRALPRNPDIRYHRAAVALATGDTGRARRELVAAVQLDPSLRDRADVRELDEKLRRSK